MKFAVFALLMNVSSAQQVPVSDAVNDLDIYVDQKFSRELGYTIDNANRAF